MWRKVFATITCRQSDHGLASVWLNRRHDRPGWGATPEPTEEFSYAMEFPSVAAFVAAARKE